MMLKLKYMRVIGVYTVLTPCFAGFGGGYGSKAELVNNIMNINNVKRRHKLFNLFFGSLNIYSI